MSTEYDPKDLNEYNKKYHTNTRTEGYGMDTHQIFACAFCGEPDLFKAYLMDFANQAKGDHTCEKCGRTVRIKISSSTLGTVLQIGFVGGDPLPDWYPLWGLTKFQEDEPVVKDNENNDTE